MVTHRPQCFIDWAVSLTSSEEGFRTGPGKRMGGVPRAPETRVEALAKVEAGALIFVERVELPPYHYAVTFERVASRS